MMNKAVVILVAAAMIITAAAQADVSQPMVRFVSTDPGVNLTVFHPFVPGGETFPVGVYNVIVDLPDGLPAFEADSFCIDLKQYSTPISRPYVLEPLQLAPRDSGSDYGPMGTAKADAIRELWGEHFADVTDGNSAAAFQSAIWEIIYENANSAVILNPWDTTDGNFSIADAGIAATANAWLSDINGSNTLEVDLFALTNDTSETTFQDIVVKLPGGGRPPVPEPVTMATLAMALSSLGVYVRRRTQA